MLLIRARVAAKQLENTYRAWFVCITLMVLSAHVVAEPQMHVLLTNDDGYDAPGIVAMHRALLAAGYRVTVVAPRNQQSGSSMRVTMGSIAVERLQDGFWTVAGTPADSVSYALQKLLVDDRPELVISGINFGQNLGANTNLSGTVGAAIMASQLGLPSIAVSVGLDLNEADSVPVRFPSTMNAFAPAAQFIIELMRNLEQTRTAGALLLSSNTVLNVNYPGLAPQRVKGARLTQVSRIGGFVPRFVETEKAGEINIELKHSDPSTDNVPDSDTVLFAAGYITLSVLDGYLASATASSTNLRGRIAPLLPAPVAP